MKKILVITLVFFAKLCLATTYYVGGSGALDSNPGTVSAPFATIQKAAQVAVAGDMVIIRSGVYRETITPTNSGSGGSPIIYQADAGATVVISGLNVIDNTGWTPYTPIANVYQKTIALPASGNFNSAPTSVPITNTYILANQLFKDGEMQPLARYPDISTPEDMLDKTKMRIAGTHTSIFTNTSITDPGLGGFQANALVDGYASLMGWYASETRRISSNSASKIDFETGSLDGAKYRQFYYITNALALLNADKEWFYKDGILYYRQVGGGIPTGLEFKARNWGFNLQGKSNIQIKGLQFKGCDAVKGSNTTTNTLIDGIVSTYPNHGFLNPAMGPESFNTARHVGLQFAGANNVVRNSEFKYGIQGIWSGSNTRIENCKFSYFGHDGTYGAPISFLQGANGAVVTKNTITRTGRSGIFMGCYNLNNNPTNSYLNLDVSYNDISYHSLLLVDNGAIYSNVRTNLTGTRIHHNWFHHNGVSRITSVEGVQVTGGYFDQTAGPLTYDHNVHWGGDEADYFDEGFDSSRMDRGKHLLYNNTFASAVNPSLTINSSIRGFRPSTPPNEARNNIMTREQTYTGINIAYSVFSTTPGFVGTGDGGLAYRITTSSPARDAGITLPSPYTDGSVGSQPDIGAYEFGGVDWTAGYVAVTVPLVPPPTNGLINLKLNEAAGIAPVNSGSVGVSFNRSASTPASTNNVPAIVGGANAFDFGTASGNFYVESTAVINELKALNAVTVTGWINNKNSTEGGGGNRIVSWINNGGNGLDLVYKNDGSLQLGVNSWPDNSIARSSSNKVTTNASAPAGNWIFFAVSYQSSNGAVKFYFGNNTQDATFDVQRVYSQGVLGSNIGKLAIGHFNDATRASGTYDRVFRGLIDDIQIHPSELTLNNIIAIQRGAGDNVAPTIPTNLVTTSVGNLSVGLSWTASTDNVAVTGYDIFRGGTTYCGSSATTNFTVTGLTAGTAYSFTVKAKDAAGNISAASTALPVTTLSLPSPWLTQDIGSVGVTGSASFLSGVFTGTGSGTDIWNTADQFRYIYRTLTGDGEITARVATLANGDPGAKAGVMIRETLTTGSRHALINVTPLPENQFLWRSTTGSTTSYAIGGTTAAPYWVRLKRVGNTFSAYRSADGITWLQTGTNQTISMTSQVYVGLVVMAKNNATTITATFDNVVLRDGAGNPMGRIATEQQANVEDDDVDVLTGAKLYQNYPNPFPSKTIIEMYIPASSQSAEVRIFDQLGTERKSVPVIQRGNVEIEISNDNLGSGVYLYFLNIDGRKVGLKRMISIH